MTSNDSGLCVGIGALRNSDVFTAVRVIASDLATNPIEYSDKRISVLLNKAPNDHMTAWGFKFALAANMLLNGNSFARVTKNPSGQVTGFELVTNSQMVVKGLSPLYSLRDEVGVQKSGHALLKGFFNTGVQGTGILKVNKIQLDTKAKENIRNKFEAANSGDNALKTIILDNDMDYKQLEVNTDVLNLVNFSDWTTKQIAKAFGLPLDRLGIESEHSNAVQSNLIYLQNT